MTRKQMEKKLAERLNLRYQVMQKVKSNRTAYETNKICYNGMYEIVAQIGGYERREDGTHYVELY